MKLRVAILVYKPTDKNYTCYKMNKNVECLSFVNNINPLGTDLFEKIFACGTDLIFGCLE